MSFRQIFVYLSIVFFSTNLAFADEAEAPKVEIKAKLWTRFTYDATKDSAHQLGFDIYRAYLQAGYKFNDTWSALFLLDGTRGDTITITPSTGAATTGEPKDNYILAYVRNLYIQAQNLWPENGNFRFGFQPTLYVSLVDGVTKTRWLGKSLADESGILTSQAGGIAGTGAFNDGMFRYGLMLHNGIEGLKAVGSRDNRLAILGMFTVMPMIQHEGFFQKMGLTLAGEWHPQSKNSSKRVVENGYRAGTAALHNESEFLDFAIEGIFNKNNESADALVGYGFTANAKYEDCSLYVRFFSGDDAFQMNSSMKAKHVLTIGPTYSFIKEKLQTALLYELRKDSVASGPMKNTHLLSWNWAANF